jgi:hypothetical protein
MVIGACTVQVPNIDIPDLLPADPFVVSGTAYDGGREFSCLEWRADTGIVYHLFQTASLANEEFDLLATPGVRSRLVLQYRDDIAAVCGVGRPVDVLDVLEIQE